LGVQRAFWGEIGESSGESEVKKSISNIRNRLNDKRRGERF